MPTFLENSVIVSPAKKQRTLVFLDLKSHHRGLFLRQHNTVLVFFFNVGLSPPTSLATADLNWPERQLQNRWLMFSWTTTADFALFMGVQGGLSGPKDSCFSKLQSSAWLGDTWLRTPHPRALPVKVRPAMLGPRAAMQRSCLRAEDPEEQQFSYFSFTEVTV